MKYHTMLTSKGWKTNKYLAGRSSGYWGKEYALTWGGLDLYVLQDEKSTEVIVATGNKP